MDERKLILSNTEFFLETFEVAKDVSAICEPLLNYGISYFLYSCIFDNGSIHFQTNRPEICHNHFFKQYPLIPAINKKLIKKKFYYLAAPLEDNIHKFNYAISDFRLFNIGHCIFFLERHKDYYELIVFGATLENYEIINFYLNNIDFLENFKFYFKAKAQKLIVKSEKNKLVVPKPMFDTVQAVTQLLNLESKQQNPANTFVPDYYFFNYNDKKIKLTKREMDCLRHIKSSLSAKEIARVMDISYRTVESYLENIKNKLQCHKKSEIIKIIDDLNIK